MPTATPRRRWPGCRPRSARRVAAQLEGQRLAVRRIVGHEVGGDARGHVVAVGAVDVGVALTDREVGFSRERQRCARRCLSRLPLSSCWRWQGAGGGETAKSGQQVTSGQVHRSGLRFVAERYSTSVTGLAWQAGLPPSWVASVECQSGLHLEWHLDRAQALPRFELDGQRLRAAVFTLNPISALSFM